MKFPAPLIPGVLRRRYKRFLADVELTGGETVTAHCPNSGSMMGVSAPGLPVWLSPANNPKRRLGYTLELVRVDGQLVGVNTGHPNRLVAEAVGSGAISELAGYETIRREVRYGRNSRIDLLLEKVDRPDCYVEVKNVHMKRGDSPDAPAEFPDAVTARGAKHLVELSDMVQAGARTVTVFLVQREDCASFRIAEDIDPTYAAGLARAMDAGVEILVYRCALSVDQIAVSSRIALEL